MNNQVLTIEQMQELKKLGIDISNASMYWVENDFDASVDLCINFYPEETNKNVRCTPTFILQDILEMLPNSILGSTKQIKTVEFKLSTRGNKVYYMQDNFNQQWLKCTNGNTLLEAAFNMLKWCKQNNYI